MFFSLGNVFTLLCTEKIIVYFGPKYTQVILSVLAIRLFYLISGPFTTRVQGVFHDM